MTEETIFAEAAAIASPVERTKFLDEACAGNAELRTAVDRLLQLHESAGSFLENPPVEASVAATILQVDGSTCDDEDANPAGQPMRDNPDDEIPLGFLQPSSQPKSLGRLGHYEILEVIGRGAFGTVLRAFDEKLQRVVAIKVLAPEMAATSPARKRFLREARTSAAIRHENVVSIHAVEDEPIPYLVMEYIPGKTLQQRLDEHGPLDLQDVLRLGKQIADGLAAAHAQGLIHRDIKPGNILLEGGVTERVKITDFGLARTADDASLTQSGLIAGTPMYMAPEQALGHKLDQRADLFSLGSVLYQMISGRPPFRAPTTLAVLKRVAEDQPRPIQEIIPELPSWVCELIGHLHTKNPDNRYGSAQEVSDLLARCLDDLKAGRHPKIPSPNASIAPADSTTSEPGRVAPVRAGTAPLSRPRPWPKVAAAALLLLVGLTITEAIGVTHLASTVIRLSTGSGTLVIETDNAGVQIAINGEEVTIRGGGVEELTLRPGEYQIEATKDGQQVKRELVSISRNGRTVVRMSLESNTGVAKSNGKSHENSALAFDGDGDHVETPLTLDVTRPFTVEAFVTVHRAHKHGGQVISNSHWGGFGLSIQPHGKWRLTVGKKHDTKETYDHYKVYYHVESDNDALLNRRKHVAGVFDGSELRLYVDGKLQSNPSKVSDPQNSRAKILIGRNPEPGDRVFQPLDGTIDEVRISTVARYTDHFAPATRFETDDETLGLYHFDEGTGDVLNDSSGNGHHGKIVGATWVKADAAPQANRESASGQPVDLIGLLEPSRDFLDNRLKLQDGKLITPPFKEAPGAIGMIPYGPVPADYDIELQLQRLSNRGPGFNLGLLVGGRQVAVGMDSGSLSEKVWGLDFLDANPGHHRLNPTRNPGSRLLLGKTCEVTIQVRNNHITASCDGETLIDWTGDPERLSLWKEVKLPRSDALFFWAQADFVVHKMTLIPRGAAASPQRFDWTSKWTADAPPLAIAPFDKAQAQAHQAAWAKYLGVPVEKEIVLGRDQRGLDIKLSMILVPPGEFVMGSSDEQIKTLREQAMARGIKRDDLDFIDLEGPPRPVRITRPFYMSKYEFTTEQFRTFVEADHYETEPEASGEGAWVPRPGVLEKDPEFTWKKAGRLPQGPDSPVVNITWNDANRCCVWLSQQDADLKFALPTEAQWEYACRAGTTTSWFTGNEESSLAGYAAINANWPKTIGERLPNPFGLCDMHGNVWELCQDALYNYRDAGTVDPIGAVDGEKRIIRGGSCYDGTGISKFWMENSGSRSASRCERRPDNPLLQIGFRVAAAISDDVIAAAVARNADKSRLPADTPLAAIAPFDADQAKAHQEAWAKHLGVPVEKEIVLGRDQRGLDVKLTMVLVPPGEFLMGSSDEEIKTLREQAMARGVHRHYLDWIELEGPQRRVRITRPFYLSQHEFTTEQFRAFVDATGYRTEPETDGRGAWPAVGERSPDFHWQRVKGQGPQWPDSPVVNITWNDANRCCEWLSQQDAGLTFALPTEAQWEFACRAGTTTLWSTGDEESSLENHTVINARWTSDVGGRLPNPFGLCDMHGNVWEYCQEAEYNYRDAGTVDPLGAVDGERRIIRGGSCFGAVESKDGWMEKSGCRSAVRYHRLPDNPLLQVGFRVTAAISDDVIQAAVDRNKNASQFQQPAAAPPFHRYATGEWIDVIPLIDPQLDKWDMHLTGKNEWRIEQGELVAIADEKPSKLLLPLDSDFWPSFECELDVTRRAGELGFNLNLPAGTGDSPLGFDRLNKPGINLFMRQRGPVSLADTRQIETGKRTTLRIEVRQTTAGDRITVWNNDGQDGTWTGDRRQLAFINNEGYPHSRRLSLWVSGEGSEYVFHRIRVRTLDGATARAVRTLSADTEPAIPPPADATLPVNVLTR